LRVCSVVTVASICTMLAACPSWAKSRSSSSGQDVAVQRCIGQVQAEFGGPRNSPDEDARARVLRYRSCILRGISALNASVCRIQTFRARKAGGRYQPGELPW
jgi:hypothetical protein